MTPIIILRNRSNRLRSYTHIRTYRAPSCTRGCRAERCLSRFHSARARTHNAVHLQIKFATAPSATKGGRAARGAMVFYISFWNRQNADTIGIEKNNNMQRSRYINLWEHCIYNMYVPNKSSHTPTHTAQCFEPLLCRTSACIQSQFLSYNYNVMCMVSALWFGIFQLDIPSDRRMLCACVHCARF